jgi:hypothetical protein
MAMRFSKLATIITAAISLAPSASYAAASVYICALQAVYECHAIGDCKEANLDAVNLSDFMILDVDKKQLTSAGMGGPSRTEDIEGITVTDKAIYLYGTQDQETWNATLMLETGDLVGGIASGKSSFALFGACTPK